MNLWILFTTTLHLLWKYLLLNRCVWSIGELPRAFLRYYRCKFLFTSYISFYPAFLNIHNEGITGRLSVRELFLLLLLFFLFQSRDNQEILFVLESGHSEITHTHRSFLMSLRKLKLVPQSGSH